MRTNVNCRVMQLPEMTVEASDGSEEEGVFERTQLPTEQELLEGILVRYPGILRCTSQLQCSVSKHE